jgi:uncharacterized RDD family membrane protein YckC
MTKPQWWERLVAAIIDGLVFLIPAIVIQLIFGLIAGRSLVLGLIMSLFGVLIVTGGIIAYKVLLEGGARQATIGKMVLGLQVVAADTHGPLTMQQTLIRTWPWWLNLLTFLQPVPVLGSLIGFLVLVGWIVIIVMTAIDPNGQGPHDKMAGALVVKTGKGMIGQ